MGFRRCLVLQGQGPVGTRPRYIRADAASDVHGPLVAAAHGPVRPGVAMVLPAPIAALIAICPITGPTRHSPWRLFSSFRSFRSGVGTRVGDTRPNTALTPRADRLSRGTLVAIRQESEKQCSRGACRGEESARAGADAMFWARDIGGVCEGVEWGECGGLEFSREGCPCAGESLPIDALQTAQTSDRIDGERLGSSRSRGKSRDGIVR